MADEHTPDATIAMLSERTKTHTDQIATIFDYRDKDQDRMRTLEDSLIRTATLLEGVAKTAHDPSTCPGVRECLATIQRTIGGSAVVKWAINGGLIALGALLAKLIDGFGK